jgi:ribonuclease P protein component
LNYVFHIQSQEAKASQDSWFSCSPKNQDRKAGSCSPEKQRKEEAGRLSCVILALNKEQFEMVMKKGKMIHSPLFSLYYLKGESSAFAAVASKKVSKKAVIRNRNKRRVREILRKNKEMLPSGSYILFIKKDLNAINHKEVSETLLKLCS